MTTSISSGHSAQYLTGQVGAGRESYYLDATTAGEPPGRWSGKGAEAFGLSGEVDHGVMHALFTEFRDPRDPLFADPETRSEAARLGRAPGQYKTAEEILAAKIEAELGSSARTEPGPDGLLADILPERLEQLRLEAERQERQPVAFMDATFSPPKSVTVAHTAFSRMELDAEKAGDLSAAAEWRHRRLVVEEAVWAGNQAMLENLSARAGFSRTGQHRGKNGNGSGRWIDAHDWTVASFFQHTSRDLDPQLHVHNAILNRVVCEDGQVRTLDGKAIYAAKQGAGTIGDRTMEAYLTARLGVEWVMRKDGVGRELAGIGQAEMDLFSERSAKIGRKLSGLVEEFREHFDREPTALELDRMRRQSTMATRRSKTHQGETREQQLDRWDDTLRTELAGGLGRVADGLARTHKAAKAAGRLAVAPNLSGLDHAEDLAVEFERTGGQESAEGPNLSASGGSGQTPAGADLPAGRTGEQNLPRGIQSGGGQTDGQDPWSLDLPATAPGGQGAVAAVNAQVAGVAGELSDLPGTSGQSAEETGLADLVAIAGQTAAAQSAEQAARPTGRMIQPVDLSAIEQQMGRRRVSPTWSPTGVVAEAVAACQLSRAAFSRAELVRQILLAMPDNLPTVRVGEIAETLADQALSDPGQVVQVTGAQPTRTVPKELQLASGASAYASPTGVRYATHGHIVAEQALRRAGVERGRTSAEAHEVQRWLTQSVPGQSLGPDQAAAVTGLMTSGAALSVLVGPAGTGKSHTVGALADGWSQLTGGRLFGLATSQIATEVLAEDGVTARNISQWLKLQARLQESEKPSAADRAFQLSEDDLVVVDEASMVDTVALEKIRAHVDRAGARLVLTGDPRQLAAVGAGGAMEMLADGVADTYTLAEVRRFNNAWEREASLRLREGDPDVILEYDRRGRIMTTSTRENAGTQAARAYLGDSLAGKASIVVVPTNAEAATVSAGIRENLIQLGRVQEEGVILGLDGNTCGVGDLIQTRRNNWPLGVINRRRYIVEEVRPDGGLLVRVDGTTELRTLPGSYVQQHVTLGYASTAHSAQGITVDTAHAVVSEQLGAEGLYVALSRGREANTAWVVTQPEVDGEETGATHARETRSANAVLVDVLDQDTELERAALVQRAEDLRRAGSMYTIHAQYEEAMRFVNRIRTDGWLDRLAVDGTVSEDDRMALASDQATDQLSRLLRSAELAGHSPADVLRTAITEQRLDNAQSIAQVLQYRITQRLGNLRPTEDQLGDSQPADVPEHWQQHLDELSEAAANRRRELGTELAETPEDWALEALGPVPDELLARAEWEHRAGLIAGYREAHPSDHEDGVVLGPAPGTSTPEKRAAWTAVWSALGRPEASAEDTQLSEGALRLRMKAWQREQQWAPRPVNAEMRATGQNRARYEQEAAILRAQADAAGDDAERERLLEEAAGRQELAETMREVEAGLAVIAEERAAWIVETAATRDAAERAREELASRGRDIGGEDDRITTEEWLEAHDATQRAEEEALRFQEEMVPDPQREEHHLSEIERRMAHDFREQTKKIVDDHRDQTNKIMRGEDASGRYYEAVDSEGRATERVYAPVHGDEALKGTNLYRDDSGRLVERVPEKTEETSRNDDQTTAVVNPGRDDVEQSTTKPDAGADLTRGGEASRAPQHADAERSEEAATKEAPAREKTAPERELPRGVPTPAETDAAVDEARAAAAELANRRSQEKARQQTEADRRAEAEQEAREAAWREQELQAERAAAERSAAEQDDAHVREL